MFVFQMASLLVVRLDLAHRIVDHLGIIFAADFALISPSSFLAVQSAPRLVSIVRCPFTICLEFGRRIWVSADGVIAPVRALPPVALLQAFPGLRELREHGLTADCAAIGLLSSPHLLSAHLQPEFMETVEYCRARRISLSLEAANHRYWGGRSEWMALLLAPPGAVGQVSIKCSQFRTHELLVDDFLLAPSVPLGGASGLPQIKRIDAVAVDISDFNLFASDNRAMLEVAARGYPACSERIPRLRLRLGHSVSAFHPKVELSRNPAIGADSLHICDAAIQANINYLRTLIWHIRPNSGYASLQCCNLLCPACVAASVPRARSPFREHLSLFLACRTNIAAARFLAQHQAGIESDAVTSAQLTDVALGGEAPNHIATLAALRKPDWDIARVVFDGDSDSPHLWQLLTSPSAPSAYRDQILQLFIESQNLGDSTVLKLLATFDKNLQVQLRFLPRVLASQRLTRRYLEASADASPILPPGRNVDLASQLCASVDARCDLGDLGFLRFLLVVTATAPPFLKAPATLPPDTLLHLYHMSARFGHVPAVTTLASRCARQPDACGRTALMLAVLHGHYRVCEVLLDAEAGLLTASGLSAVSLACRCGLDAVARLLLPREHSLHNPQELLTDCRTHTCADTVTAWYASNSHIWQRERAPSTPSSAARRPNHEGNVAL
jgi:hypothetical protein